MAERKSDLPPLAQYRSLSEYIPNYGDYIVWTGWLTTWHGVVINHDPDDGDVYIIFSSIPFVLFTLEEHEQERETRKIKLSSIRGASHGTWAALQHDFTRNSNVWYL